MSKAWRGVKDEAVNAKQSHILVLWYYGTMVRIELHTFSYSSMVVAVNWAEYHSFL